MLSLKLNASGDLDLSTGTVQTIDGADQVAQKIRIRMRTFLGEWFLDTRIGIPYLQKILGQKRRKSVLDAIFRKAIQTTPGVASIAAFNTSWNGITRTLGISLTATTTDGTLLTISNEEFII